MQDLSSEEECHILLPRSSDSGDDDSAQSSIAVTGSDIDEESFNKFKEEFDPYFKKAPSSIESGLG